MLCVDFKNSDVTCCCRLYIFIVVYIYIYILVLYFSETGVLTQLEGFQPALLEWV